ncbi:MAG: 50S ribosomal protein L11 methyltransferase [Muribaculaceae bacterium]|nr:50S ribosomal protein L11 methyltransferase [Muribaculaceae bacterium]
MNDYYAVRVDASPCTPDINDLAAAFMADAGFESFEPDDSGLTAYIRVEEGDGVEIAGEALQEFPIDTDFKISETLVKGQNWNEEWERHYFKSIVIAGECVVHSSFHKDVPEAQYDILIDPKMAFGTGHHDTTSQMIRHILSLPMQGKSVIDMGTGTGILGILAAMRGASPVTGIEIDGGAFENALENIGLNKVCMTALHGDASKLAGITPADYLFANINRNIILEDIDRYAAVLKPGGIMLLSGFYEEDVPMVAEAAAKHGLEPVSKLVSNRWTALKMKKILCS